MPDLYRNRSRRFAQTSDRGLSPVWKRIKTKIIYEDDELFRSIEAVPATNLGMDAPLFLPLGRCCLRNDCTCPRYIHFRECDLELRRRGIRFFPITLGPMRMLTERGMQLAAKLSTMGHVVLETYPGAAQDVWGIPRQADVRGLRRGLTRFVSIGKTVMTCHELDAVTCALLAKLHWQGRTELIGRPDEGWMLLPQLTARFKSTANRGKTRPNVLRCRRP